MKRTLLIILALLVSLTGTLYAVGQYKGYNTVTVQYEGVTLSPDDVPGILMDGRTLIPIGLLRKANFDVAWDSKTLTANITPKKPITVTQTVKTIEQIKALSDRVAYVGVYDDNGKKIQHGSGFVINSKGLMITCFHVADKDGLRELRVELNGKTYVIPKGQFSFADETEDIYGVYLNDTKPFPYIQVNTDLPVKNDIVHTIGNPQGERNVLTSGKVDFTFEKNGVTKISGTLMAIGGNSGGPMINKYGEVVGVVYSGIGEIEDATAVSMADVQELYESSFNN